MIMALSSAENTAFVMLSSEGFAGRWPNPIGIEFFAESGSNCVSKRQRHNQKKGFLSDCCTSTNIMLITIKTLMQLL